MRNLWFSLCFWIFGGWFKQLGFLVSDLKLRFYLVNYRFLTDFCQTSHSFLPTHGRRKSVRNLWFSLCFWIFGGWFKQLGFLVSDLKLRFYLVNYRFLTDFCQTSHSFLPTHGWRKSVRNLWFSLCFWIVGGWLKHLGFFVCDLKLRFYLVNYKFITDSFHHAKEAVCEKICNLLGKIAIFGHQPQNPAASMIHQSWKTLWKLSWCGVPRAHARKPR